MKASTGCATVAFCLMIRIMQRTILIIIGWLAVVLEYGRVLPLLPTTC